MVPTPTETWLRRPPGQSTRPHRITLTLAAFPTNGAISNDLLLAADEALAKAASLGGNRIITSAPALPN